MTQILSKWRIKAKLPNSTTGCVYTACSGIATRDLVPPAIASHNKSGAIMIPLCADNLVEVGIDDDR